VAISVAAVSAGSDKWDGERRLRDAKRGKNRNATGAWDYRASLVPGALRRCL